MIFSKAYSLKNCEVNLNNCDNEPVHTPGCIQEFGSLIVIHPETYKIIQISDNAFQWFGKEPRLLLNISLSHLIGKNNLDQLKKLFNDKQIEELPRYVFTLHLGEKYLDFLAHYYDGLIILECEEADINENDNIYDKVNVITKKLLTTTTLKEFSQILVKEMRNLTSLDRVMLYKFHEDLSGEVIAEAKNNGLHSYLSLRYPAEDIPKPARDIFKKIWIRPLPNVFYKQSELIPLLNPSTKKPLDMTYAFLRGASVMYTDYLKNMSVHMSLTLSIIIDGELWGLIACHHNSMKSISWAKRAACELLAQFSSLQLKNVENSENKIYRKKLESVKNLLIQKISKSNSLVTDIIQENILNGYINASGVSIFENGKLSSYGITPTHDQLNELYSYLISVFAQKNSNIFYTQSIGKILIEAKQYKDIASGILAITFSRNHENMIIWFRKELLQIVNWAGDPYTKPLENSTFGKRLLPRTSFALWQETVRGHSEIWQNAEIEAVLNLREALIESLASRAQELNLINSKLELSNSQLDAFAHSVSHDLREPLRGINYYAQFLKEKITTYLDTESLNYIENLMKLAKRMSNLIESLLFFSQLQHIQIDSKKVDMKKIVQESLDNLIVSINEKNAEVSVQDSLPHAIGEEFFIKVIWINLISNALKYSNRLNPKIEIGSLITQEGLTYYVKDNGIGIAQEHQEIIFKLFKRIQRLETDSEGSGAGLSLAKQAIERHSGKIWLESKLGEGSIFYFTLN
ncbi:hypothetical protein IM40_11140 (plasmid) [Candidatus Paracaedimonas acanthamoebae]|nr:hypothetical protein IM40_11140 [Candidatus Paracaedimonas acanthamoebae]